MKTNQKTSRKRGRNEETPIKKRCEKKVAKKSAKAQSGTLPQVPKSIQFNKIESYLSKEKPLKRKTSEKKNL